MGCDLGATTAAIKVARRPACIAYPRAQTSRVTSQEIDWLQRAIVNRDQVATGDHGCRCGGPGAGQCAGGGQHQELRWPRPQSGPAGPDAPVQGSAHRRCRCQSATSTQWRQNQRWAWSGLGKVVMLRPESQTGPPIPPQWLCATDPQHRLRRC